MKKFLILLLLCPNLALAQDSLLFDDFIVSVKSNHPLVRQANLQLNRGQANQLKSKGSFDPKIEANHTSKQFNDKNYFNLNGAQIKYPTPWALELKGGYELNNGQYLDPSLTTSEQGLMNLGLSLPLLQGLWIDERRTTLRLASAYLEFTSEEQQILINEVLYKAYDLYWNWWSQHEKLIVAKELVAFAEIRMNNVRQRALLGQSAALDTIETNIQLNLRRQQAQELEVQELKSRYLVSSMLWQEKAATLYPLPLADGSVPSNQPDYTRGNWLGLKSFNDQMDSLLLVHPLLRQYAVKLEMGAIDLQWKKEKIKPKLNVNYNLLAEPIGGMEPPPFSTQQYKLGFDFSFPILVREARGDVQLSKIKLAETTLDFDQKKLDIKNKAIVAHRAFSLYQNQLALAEKNIADYLLMLEGERIRFLNGESSVFIVNQREAQYAEARNKWVDLRLKVIQSYFDIGYYLGILSRY
jgi:outer membrane protein TolC